MTNFERMLSGSDIFAGFLRAYSFQKGISGRIFKIYVFRGVFCIMGENVFNVFKSGEWVFEV